MNLSTLIGLCAAVLTTVSFVPQVLKTWSTRKTDGISLVMYLCFVLGILLWLLYGILGGDLPVILANAVTLVLASVVLGFKIFNVFAKGEKP